MTSVKQSIKLVLILSVVLSSITFASENQKNWQQVTDDNGIQVYTLETTNSKIVKAKAVAIIKAPIKIIKTTLDDIDHRYEWIPFLISSKALTQFKNNKRIEYSHFYAPWPASDRDFVYEIKLVTKTPDKLVYKMQSVDSSLMPVNEDKIRANLFETTYVLTVIDAQTTKVELIYYADPKGWIPNWIINIIQQILPYKIMHNLAERAVK